MTTSHHWACPRSRPRPHRAVARRMQKADQGYYYFNRRTGIVQMHTPPLSAAYEPFEKPTHRASAAAAAKHRRASAMFGGAVGALTPVGGLGDAMTAMTAEKVREGKPV